MTPEALNTTNIWLGVLAVVSLLEFLMILGAAFMGLRLYHQVQTLIQQVERRHIEPLAARVNAAVEEVQELADRVKRADDRVHEFAERVELVASRAVLLARWRVIPAVGLLRGARAAFRYFRQADRTPSGPTSLRPVEGHR